MGDRQKDRQALLEAEDDVLVYVNWHESGGGEVYRKCGKWHLDEIPQYGGLSRDGGWFDDVDALLDVVYSWT
jgi:hypothetical protein